MSTNNLLAIISYDTSGNICIQSLTASALVGREVKIMKKDKKSLGKMESAFLQGNTDVYDVTFQTEKSIKIKIEADTNPSLNFTAKQKLLLPIPLIGKLLDNFGCKQLSRGITR